jgi:hypothetical protein
MSVTLSHVAPRYAVSDANDPFKKYWWAILMGIVFTGLWLLAPMMGEKSVGATAINTSKPKTDGNVEQALTADAGDGINLSMDGTGKKRKEEGALGSGLFLAPDEPAAGAGSAALGGPPSGVRTAGGSTLADALKKVGESSGGWGEKAQRGFANPKLAGGSPLSGMGAASGGKAGSASGAFGTSNANVGYAGTRGLAGDGNVDVAIQSGRGVAALKAAADQAVGAAANRSNDGSRSSSGLAFDGGKGGSKIGGNLSTGPGVYAALDAAPVNLKVSDPKDTKKVEGPPPSSDLGDSDMSGNDIGKQIAMQLVGAAIGAAIGGPIGGIVSSSIMKVLENQQAQEQKVRDLHDKIELDRMTRQAGGKSSPAAAATAP